MQGVVSGLAKQAENNSRSIPFCQKRRKRQDGFEISLIAAMKEIEGQRCVWEIQLYAARFDDA